MFWNSGTNNADIIVALANLASSLGNINIDMPRFASTIVNNVFLSQETITKIVVREQKSRRTTLQVLSGSAASHVVILHGVSTEPTLEQVLNSPWDLKPGETGTDDLDGGYEIWAYAVGGDADIKIALEYQSDTQNNTQNNIDNVNMNIKPFFGTGANWTNDNNPDWTNGNESELNSNITGFKLFSFTAFNPNQDYTLTISPGSLNYQAVPYPINIYLFTLDAISKAAIWQIVKEGGTYFNDLRINIIPILKKSSWAARLPATGGNFVLKPNFNRYVGVIDVKLVSETYAKTAIFNYQQGQETGTFTLVGP